MRTRIRIRLRQVPEIRGIPRCRVIESVGAEASGAYRGRAVREHDDGSNSKLAQALSSKHFLRL